MSCHAASDGRDKDFWTMVAFNPLRCKSHIFLVLLATMICVGPVRASSQETVRLVHGGSTLAQIGVDILRIAYGRAEIPVEFQSMPLERALLMSTGGKRDGEVMRSLHVLDKYPSLKLVGVPLFKVVISAFSREGSTISISSPDDLHDLTVAYVRGVKAQERLVQNAKQSHAVSSVDQMFSMIKSGRVDVGISGNISDLERVNADGKPRVIASSVLIEIPLYHMLHESKGDVVDAISSILTDMEQAGELNEIFVDRVRRVIEPTS